MSEPTTDPEIESFVPVPDASDFPIQNLPFGLFRLPGESEPRIGVAIGEMVLDLSLIEEQGLLDTPKLKGKGVFREPSLNSFLALGREAWCEARLRIHRLLRSDEPTLRDDATLRAASLRPMAAIEMLLPVKIGDYTDFYSSREHATNVGTMFRGADNALMPNWLHLPVAYHGRASSVIVTGTDIRRPYGQTKTDAADAPTFHPTRRLDIELEMGFFVGPGNKLGSPIPVTEAREHIFGMVLVNDWSARDIQKWEYQPLGPFLAKNFATSISPWIVTLDALAPFRCPGPVQDPTPLPHLRNDGERAYDIVLEVCLQTATMREPHRIARTNFKYLYWDIDQQLAHHTSSGCNMRTGDLLASGTISGPTEDSRGSLLELTWAGKEPIRLPNGEERRFLEDGDRVTIRGRCESAGYRIGFGEVTAKVLPAEG